MRKKKGRERDTGGKKEGQEGAISLEGPRRNQGSRAQHDSSLACMARSSLIFQRKWKRHDLKLAVWSGSSKEIELSRHSKAKPAKV
jgi:hypothetical protein